MARDDANPIDMSLRFWSGGAPLAPYVERMGLTAKILYRPGDVMYAPKLRSPRIADQHYASIAHGRCRNNAGVANWLTGIVHLLDDQSNLVGLMRAGTVKATIWITTLISDPPLAPVQLDPALVRAATATGAEILVEDYNRKDDEGVVPAKTWFR